MMISCPFCNRTFVKSLRTHLTVHFKGENALIQAYEQHTNKSVVDLYVNHGKSASEIMNLIRSECNWIKPIKGHILKFLDDNNVVRRKTSEAMKSYYTQNDVWNKDKTKYDHESIMKYANSRTGENNPIHKTTFEQRSYSNAFSKLKREGRLEELEKLKSDISDGVTNWFSHEENYEKYIAAYDAARPKQLTNVRLGVQNYHKRYADLGLPSPNRIAWISNPELIVKSALEQLNMKFQHQWYYARACFDFYLHDYKTIIEVNGTYWHGHESIFENDEMIHPNKKISIKDIKARDEQKRVYLVENGFKLITLWDNEFKTTEDVVKILVEKLEISNVENNIS